MATMLSVGGAFAQEINIYQATIGEPGQKTEEVSTERMRRTVSDGSAIILDTRPRAGENNLEGPPEGAITAVEKLVGGDKGKALVLYCTGPFCQASRRMSDQLLDAGFTNVRRYQLGMLIWRALGGPTEVELEGVVRVFRDDKTAVFFDARSAEGFANGSIPGAHNLPPRMPPPFGAALCCSMTSIRALCCLGVMPLKHGH
jgi:rhodanese-related sulfurtransferase